MRRYLSIDLKYLVFLLGILVGILFTTLLNNWLLLQNNGALNPVTEDCYKTSTAPAIHNELKVSYFLTCVFFNNLNMFRVKYCLV